MQWKAKLLDWGNLNDKIKKGLEKSDLKRSRTRLTTTGALGILRLADTGLRETWRSLGFGLLNTIKLDLVWHQLNQGLVAFGGKNAVADTSLGLVCSGLLLQIHLAVRPELCFLGVW